MSDAVIVEAVRTAIGRRNGRLSPVRPDDLLALTLAEVVKRAGVDPAQVDDVVVGCVTQTGEQGMNIGRAAVLIAGFPIEVPGTTINRFCGSGQQAVNFAAQGVLSGAQDVVIGAGVESMSRVPMGSDAFGPGEGPVSPKLTDLFEIIPQGNSAEMIAKKWGFSRAQLDEFAYQSHAKAGQAIQDGRFRREILPIDVKSNGTSDRFETDEGVRIPPSREKMAQLKASFQEDGVVTAGNSSQISDGASAVLVMSAEKAKSLGLKPRARIVAQAIVGSEPTIMLTGPIPATQKVLKKAGLQLKDIDLFEVNEAFAPVVLAWQHETGADMEKVNYNGGAIALGHPLGASGARLITTMLHELERQDARYGLSTMCIGYGMGIATIVERL
ncbi:MAG: thiolase family protein [Chloroflexi bacterium]|nr:MAG: thiolase family protein [Chloroflexota bacterium]TMG50245.1 MAG: thiolase family protein [Chloroflexota bacterium]